MVYTEYHGLMNKELILLALSKESLTPLEQELLTRFTKLVDERNT